METTTIFTALGLTGFVMGVYNFVEGRETRGRVDALRGSVEVTRERIRRLDERVRENSESLNAVKRELSDTKALVLGVKEKQAENHLEIMNALTARLEDGMDELIQQREHLRRAA